MSATIISAPDTAEKQAQLADLLSLLEHAETSASGAGHAGIEVVVNGKAFPIPGSVLETFRSAISHLADGHAVALIDAPKDLTVHEAAEFLGSSTWYIHFMLNTGQIPFRQTERLTRVISRGALQEHKAGYLKARTAALGALAAADSARLDIAG